MLSNLRCSDKSLGLVLALVAIPLLLFIYLTRPIALVTLTSLPSALPETSTATDAYEAFPSVVQLVGSNPLLILSFFYSEAESFNNDGHQARFDAVENQICYAHQWNYSYRLETQAIEELERELGIELGLRKFKLPVKNNWAKPLAILKQAMTSNYQWVYWMDLDLAIFNFSVPLDYFVHTVPESAANLPLRAWENNISVIAPGHPPGGQLRSSTFAFLLKTGGNKVKDWRVSTWYAQWKGQGRDQVGRDSSGPGRQDHEVMDFLARWISHDQCDCWQDQGAMWIELAQWARRTHDRSPHRFERICGEIIENQSKMQCTCDFLCVENEFQRLNYTFGRQFPPYAAFFHSTPSSRAVSPGVQNEQVVPPVFAKHKYEEKTPTCSAQLKAKHGWNTKRLLEVLYPTATTFHELGFVMRNLNLIQSIVVEIVYSNSLIHVDKQRGTGLLNNNYFGLLFDHQIIINKKVMEKYKTLQACLWNITAAGNLRDADSTKTLSSPRPAVFLVLIHEDVVAWESLWSVWHYLAGGAWLAVGRDQGTVRAPTNPTVLLLLRNFSQAVGIARAPFNFTYGNNPGTVWAIRKLYKRNGY